MEVPYQCSSFFRTQLHSMAAIFVSGSRSADRMAAGSVPMAGEDPLFVEVWGIIPFPPK